MSLDRILCLANSYKHDHRCVAGISLTTKHWVRLVGREVPGCLTLKETCHEGGKEAGILDIFEAELGEGCGSHSHPEDVFVSKRIWNLLRRGDTTTDIRFLTSLLNKGPTVLGGTGDRVYARKFTTVPVGTSLELIQPDDLWWWIREDNGKRRNRALFRMGHVGRIRYDLAVTDPVWLNQLKFLPAGIYPQTFFFKEKLPRTLFTISLSESYEGFHYKLVAGVVHLPA
jgi:Dual OB-containing domain